MGITADLSAVRAVAKRKKRKVNTSKDARTTQCEISQSTTSIIDTDEISEITPALERRKARVDEQAASRLRLQDISDLQFVTGESDDEEDLPVIVDSDRSLANQIENERRQALRCKRLGESVTVDHIRKATERKGINIDENEKSSRVKRSRQIMPEESAKEAEGPGEVIYRDEDGFRITKTRWLELQADKKGGYKVKPKDKEKKQERQPVAWGGGVTQEEEKRKREEHERKVASEPLTRYEIDLTLDRELKESVRWDDPLRNLSSTNEQVPPPSSASASASSMLKPKCRFTAPPNRYGILPGYRWDGVIRGNEYEARFLQEKNKKLHRQVEAYKWSIEDM